MAKLTPTAVAATALALTAVQPPALAAVDTSHSPPRAYPPAARGAPGNRGGAPGRPSGVGKAMLHPAAPPSAGGAAGAGNASGPKGTGTCNDTQPYFPWPQRWSFNIRFLREGEVLPAAVRDGFKAGSGYDLGTVHALGTSWRQAFQSAFYDAIVPNTNLSYKVDPTIAIGNYSGATGYDILLLAADGLEGNGFDALTWPDNGVSVIAIRGGLKNLSFTSSATDPLGVYWVGAYHEFGAHALGAPDKPDSCWTTDGVHFNGPNYGHDEWNTHWSWDQTAAGTWPVHTLNFNENTWTFEYPP